MTLKSIQLLTIQKFIFLLDDFHYGEFTSHLISISAILPLKLAKAVRRKLPDFDSHEDLCIKIYGTQGKKQRQSFNQLASYTFKLSSNLAQNYPAYLYHNPQLLQRLINEAKSEEANFLADCIIDIAGRIEDFQTLNFALKFKVSQAFLYKDFTKAFKLNVQLEEMYETEKLRHDLTTLRQTLNITLVKSLQSGELERHKERLTGLSESKYASIRLLSRYAYIYILYYYDFQNFHSSEARRLIAEMEKEMDNYGHIVLHFMADIRSHVSFYKLNSGSFDMASHEGKKFLNELMDHFKSIKFWINYLPTPQLFVITGKAGYYLSMYAYLLHRSDYHKLMADKDLKDIQSITNICSEILSHKELEEHFEYDLLNLRMIYSSLLIISGGDNIKKGIQELESMLITYQQLNLKGMIDSIFLCLMIAYFSIKDYEKCTHTYKRYLKIVKGKSLYEANDTGIHTYYYLSQWLLSNRKQYLLKLEENFRKNFKKGAPQEQYKEMEEFIDYFDLPIKDPNTSS